MRVNSTLIASLQGSVTGGQELEVPEILLPVIELPLPLAGISVPTVDLRNVPHSIHVTSAINQGASASVSPVTLAVLDRGVYRFKGMLIASFFGMAATSADSFGAALQLVTPGGSVAVNLAVTPLMDTALTGISPAPVPFDYLYQIVQPGWLLRHTTFHNTGVGQSIGLETTVQISRLL